MSNSNIKFNWELAYKMLEAKTIEIRSACIYYEKLSYWYKIIDTGCKEHYDYKGINDPPITCETCHKIYEARKKINEAEFVDKWKYYK